MSLTRLVPDIDLEGITPDEAFSILGNEIRLDIIRALWQAGAARQYDDVRGDTRSMSFSELRGEVGVDDNGKFNYHISELMPQFVRQTDDGYRLSGAGKRIARTVIAVSGAEDVDLSADLGMDCPLCESPMTAAYRDQWLRIECTVCDGLFGDEIPEGMVYFANYPAAGLVDRSTQEAAEAGLFRCLLDQAYLMQGVCRECGGHVDATLSVCEDHDSAGGHQCGACGTRSPVWADQRCRTCGFGKRLLIELCCLGLTPVIGFLDDREINAFAPTFEEIVNLLEVHSETSVSGDPLAVTVTISGERESVSVEFDEEMNIRSIDRPTAKAVD